MKPAGVIVRYINWRKWKKWFFNVSLFLFQLLFLIVGKILGKVEVQLRQTWRAAQVSHVRLVLEKSEPPDSNVWMCANFGYPFMEIQPWHISWNDDKHLEYFDPTFEPSPEFIAPMIEYAHDQEGKWYDTLQLFSYGLNFIVWLFWWPKWGREVFRWLNLRGGREVCSSGVTADLRWADNMGGLKRAPQIITEWGCHEGYRYPLKIENRPKDIEFFPGYDTAMVMPCIVPISEKWRKVE